MAKKTKTKFTPEEKQKHIDATKGYKFKLLKEYAEKNGLSANTLRGWQNKAKSGKKPGKPGRPKGTGKKPGPKPGRKAGSRVGRPRKHQVQSGGKPVGHGGVVKSEIAEFLLNPNGTHDMETAERLLKRAYATL
jgi:transposase-like protein